MLVGVLPSGGPSEEVADEGARNIERGRVWRKVHRFAVEGRPPIRSRQRVRGWQGCQVRVCCCRGRGGLGVRVVLTLGRVGARTWRYLGPPLLRRVRASPLPGGRSRVGRHLGGIVGEEGLGPAGLVLGFARRDRDVHPIQARLAVRPRCGGAGALREAREQHGGGPGRVVAGDDLGQPVRPRDANAMWKQTVPDGHEGR